MLYKLICICIFLKAWVGSVCGSETGGKKHDVLMIAVDDLRPELGCYGCSYMKTPHIDALAHESMVFDRMYTGIALCSPSRTLFLTSRRADTSRVWTINAAEYWRRSGGNFTSLPQYFKENGYITFGTGKIFHPGAPSNGSDAEYSWSPGCLPYKNTFKEPTGEGEYSSPAVHPFFNFTDDQMAEGQVASNAIRLMDMINNKRKSGDQRPFFMAAGFHRPHIPWHAPEKYYKMYDLNMPLAPNQHTPSGVPRIALQTIFSGYWSTFADIKAVNVSKNMPYDNTTVPHDEQRRIRQAYRAAASFTDRNVGVVLEKLKDLGWYNTTIIVFWADHGYQLGDNDQYGKHTNFEHATRIPFMIRLPPASFPAFSPGRTSAFAENVDLYPTLAELAINKPLPLCPKDVHESRATQTCTEGYSMASLLQYSNKTPTPLAWKNASFSQYERDGEKVMGYTMRVDGWRYTEWVKFDNSTTGGPKWDQQVGVELYKHNTGTILPCDWNYEHTNVANNPEFASIRSQLSKRLRAGWRAMLFNAK